MRPVADVDDHLSQRLIHRDEDIGVAFDAFFVAQRFTECLAQTDADVFNCVVIINVDVAPRLHRQIKLAVLRE
ncbi:hypothetical protein D3C73_1065310 [compost metagenome]